MWDLKPFFDLTALVSDKGIKMSYRELEQASMELAKVIPKRSFVFSFCKNQPGSVIGYVSFLNHGIVPALLNAHMDRELIEQLIEAYQPSYLWIPEEEKCLFSEMEVVFAGWEYCLLKTGYAPKIPMHPDLALLLTTSGSTGSPKFVRQSYRNILANANSIVQYLKLSREEAPVTTLPMNYTYGLSIINSHLLVGARILLTDETLIQKEFWNFMKEEKATSFGGVPYTYEMLDKLRFFRMDLPDLRYMTQAGGKLSPELHKKFAEYAQEMGKQFIVMYGQCEATARMSYLPAEYSLEKYGSMGIAIPGGQFSLIDTEGREITEPEVPGELIYRGENVTLGYAESFSDLALGDERHGVLATGDMAKRDKDGFYFITGRMKRFLKVYGNRVNLDEIDALMKTKYAGLDCTSGGIDDHVYLFLTNGEIAEELKEYLSDKTSLNLKAFSVIVLDEIPKNDAGKILYRELEQYYGI